MSCNTSPSTSPVSSPISFSRPSITPSPADSLVDLSPRRSSSSTSQRSCAFPSWPRRASLSTQGNEVNAYVSDADLFPDVFELDGECEQPTLTTETQITGQEEALPSLDLLLTLNPLPWDDMRPKRRRRSSRKQRRSSKPMTPISEMPE